MEEALEKVKISLRNLKEFKTTFQEYKARLPSYYKGDKKPKTWEFQVIFVTIILIMILYENFLCSIARSKTNMQEYKIAFNFSILFSCIRF